MYKCLQWNSLCTKVLSEPIHGGITKMFDEDPSWYTYTSIDQFSYKSLKWTSFQSEPVHVQEITVGQLCKRGRSAPVHPCPRVQSGPVHFQEFTRDQFMYTSLQWIISCTRVLFGPVCVREFTVGQFMYVQLFSVDQFLYKSSTSTSSCPRVHSGPVHVPDFTVDQFKYKISQWISLYTRAESYPVSCTWSWTVNQFIDEIMNNGLRFMHQSMDSGPGHVLVHEQWTRTCKFL